MCVLERATGASLHTVAEQICEGYISYHGVRIGICGTAIMRSGELTALKNYSSLAIRIPHEIRGMCESAVNTICTDGFESTLIISPPGGGKTTALREIIRRLSEKQYRLSVIDERNELSAVGQNEVGFSLGARSDVLTGVDKSSGAMMLLRGMNPQIIAMDEITNPCDVKAVLTIHGCGVKLLASAHAKDREDLCRRQLYKELLAIGVFRYLLIIGGGGSNRTYSVRRLQT